MLNIMQQALIFMLFYYLHTTLENDTIGSNIYVIPSGNYV